MPFTCIDHWISQLFRLWAKHDRLNDGSMLKYMDFLESLGISKSSLQEGMQQKKVDIALRSRCMYFVKDLMSSSTNSSDANYKYAVWVAVNHTCL